MNKELEAIRDKDRARRYADEIKRLKARVDSLRAKIDHMETWHSELVHGMTATIERLRADVKFWNETAIEYKQQYNEVIRRGLKAKVDHEQKS